MAAGRPAPEDSRLTLAAFAESATTQSNDEFKDSGGED